jgi:hypothetical protein
MPNVCYLGQTPSHRLSTETNMKRHRPNHEIEGLTPVTSRNVSLRRNGTSPWISMFGRLNSTVDWVRWRRGVRVRGEAGVSGTPFRVRTQEGFRALKTRI